MAETLRVVLLGYIVRGPLGGLAWHHLQYAIGLARLGHEVLFVEDSDDYPSCYDPSRHVTGTDPTYGLQFAAQAFSGVGLSDKWAYHDAHRGVWHGPGRGSAQAFCEAADLLLNLSGVNPLRRWSLGIPARAFVDTDPGFTQIRHLTDEAARRRASQHTAFFSFGANLERGTSTVPDDGFAWRATRQPVVLDLWPFSSAPSDGPFTTLMQWDSFPPVLYDGRKFGLKSDSFSPYVGLPSRTREKLELAIGSLTAPRLLLESKGWLVADPLEPSRDLWTYQRFIQRSKGEFSVAKHGYVATRCGWFSERTAVYLASGRPAVVQDTGFTEWMETQAGLVAFSDADEALAGIDEVSRRYEVHCTAAREVAAEYFDARNVLARLVAEATDRVGQ